MNIRDFVGTYTVRQGTIWNDQQQPEIVAVGDQIELGTGNAAPPELQSNGSVTVGMAVLDPQGEPKSSLPGGWPTNMVLRLDGSVLFFFQGQTGEPPRRMTIALTRAEQGYRALVGNVIVGDPQQAGVWGADDEPGPTGGGGG